MQTVPLSRQSVPKPELKHRKSQAERNLDRRIQYGIKRMTLSPVIRAVVHA